MSPKVDSKSEQADSGSQMWGTVESMNAGIGVGRSDVGVGPVTMFWSWTTRSRLSCWEKAIVRLLGTNFEVSKPPNVKLPRTLFNPASPSSAQMFPQHLWTTYDIGSQRYKPNSY